MFWYEFEAWIYTLYGFTWDYDTLYVLEVELNENDDIFVHKAEFSRF